MANQLELWYRFLIVDGNEGSDEARIQFFFLTFDGSTLKVEQDFQLASESDHTTVNLDPPADGRSDFLGLRATAPTVPTEENPYLAIAIRVVEEDTSNQEERMEDANTVARLLQTTSFDRNSATAIAGVVASVIPRTNDDLIGSTAFIVSNADTLDTETQTFPNITLTGDGANYVFDAIRLFCQDGDRGAELSATAARISGDDEVAEFIRQTRIDDLALLTPAAANSLLDELFSGPTGDDDERAIIDLVSALPSATVRGLSRLGKTAAAYELEVDGDNWDELQAVLARSIPT